MTDRPTWAHTHPKDELGRVFIGIGDWDASTGSWVGVADGGSHRATWLDRDALAELRRALDVAEAWSEAHGEDCPGDCPCQN